MPKKQATKILVIDDEAAIRYSVRNYLEDYSFDVIEAHDGLQGLELFETKSPDLILVDLKMPVMDGFDVISEIIKRTDVVPLVVVSGAGVIDDAVKAVQLGAWDYILKPISDMQHLLHTVQRNLEKARLKKENISYQKNLEQIVLERTDELDSINQSLEQEIEERKQIEHKLSNSKQVLDSILKSIPDVVFRLDVSGTILFINEIIENYGYSLEDLIGHKFEDFVHPNDLRETRLISLDLRNGAQKFITKILRIFPDLHQASSGDSEPNYRIFSVKSIGLTEKTDSGKQVFSGIQAVARDITEESAARAALQTSEHRFQKLFEDIPDGMYVRQENRFLLVNAVFCEWTGFTAEELTSVDFDISEIVHPEDRTVFHESMLRSDRSNDVEFTAFRGMSRSGEVLDIELKSSPITWNNKPARLGFIRDVTEARRMQMQLQQAQKMESVGRLAGGIAHDFNNLLTAIIGHTEMILYATGKGDPIRTDLKEVLDTANSASDLTKQLLTFSRKQISQPKVVNLDKSLENMNRMLERLVGETITFTSTFQKDLKPIFVDPTYIEQIVVNLVVNAKDAMPKGGTIDIELSNYSIQPGEKLKYREIEPGDYVKLCVKDTGYGMTLEIQEHIFEPFFTTKGERKGTGLGLSTVYGIIKQVGGYIFVDSKVNEGSTFSLYFPVTQKKRVEPSSLKGSKKDVIKGSEKILIVEDEPLVRKLAARSLSLFGYQVTQARTGQEALTFSMNESESFDLVLVDIVMPEISGPDLVQKMQENWPGIATLYMSGYTDEEVNQHGVNRKDIEFISKPFSPVQLVSKIREVLDKQS